jgi:hypothetical protein
VPASPGRSGRVAAYARGAQLGHRVPVALVDGEAGCHRRGGGTRQQGDRLVPVQLRQRRYRIVQRHGQRRHREDVLAFFGVQVGSAGKEKSDEQAIQMRDALTREKEKSQLLSAACPQDQALTILERVNPGQ